MHPESANTGVVELLGSTRRCSQYSLPMEAATAACRSVDSAAVTLPGNYNLLNNDLPNDCVGYTKE